MTQTLPRARLLIVDDEVAQMRALRDTLAVEGYATTGFSSPREALTALRLGQFDLLLTDLMMPEMDGIGLISAALRVDPDLGAVVMTGHGTVDSAVLAMRSGALDYILKPFRLNVVLPVLERALNLQRLRRENATLQELERRRAEELAVAYQDLESFSYSISHDLRSPLLFVRDFAERLDEDYAERLGSEGQRLTRIIRDGCRSMDQMIEGLLAFSHATRQPLSLAMVDMMPLVRSAVAEARVAHPSPPTQVEIGDLPRAAADPGIIRHVWSNLIGNAFKYSAQKAAPVVHIKGRVEGNEAIYTVEDNGAGFDMQYADKLFGVFKRLHSPREFQGTGVGLAIAYRIVTRHGGRIWARAQPDAGATFQFALPAALPGRVSEEAPGPSSS